MASASSGARSSALGSRPETRSRVATLSTSLSMLRRTPGYCSLIASSWPSRVRARCTWPIEAAAQGVKEKRSKPCSQPLPQCVSSTCTTWLIGMVRASSRRRARMSASSGGKRLPASIDISWPTFIAAPRSCASCSATRRALAGVSTSSLTLGRLPAASWRAPSASMPPATPVARLPRRARRDRRPPGTAALRAASATGCLGSMALAAVFMACSSVGVRGGLGCACVVFSTATARRRRRSGRCRRRW